MGNAKVLARMDVARDFPVNTCAASRHAAIIAEDLLDGTPMDPRDMQHCGESIAATVAALYETRTKVARLTRERDEALALLREIREDAWTRGYIVEKIDALLARREG